MRGSVWGSTWCRRAAWASRRTALAASLLARRRRASTPSRWSNPPPSAAPPSLSPRPPTWRMQLVAADAPTATCSSSGRARRRRRCSSPSRRSYGDGRRHVIDGAPSRLHHSGSCCFCRRLCAEKAAAFFCSALSQASVPCSSSALRTIECFDDGRSARDYSLLCVDNGILRRRVLGGGARARGDRPYRGTTRGRGLRSPR